MTKTLRYASAFILVLLALVFSAAAAHADEVASTNITVVIDENGVYNLRGFDLGYAHNSYVSIRDLAAALNGTEKQFRPDVYEKEVHIDRGVHYNTVDGDGTSWRVPGTLYHPSLKRNAMYIDGQQARYYTILAAMITGVYDCWIDISDFAMIMDVNAYFDSRGVLHIHTYEPFGFDIRALNEAGYFNTANGALAADITTGEIFFAHNADAAVPIASTTKLMTYLLVMDAVSAGRTNLSSTVRISANAAALSHTEDFQLWMEEGDTGSVYELLVGMLLPSSNECALALAEHIAGSEAAFVARMNEKAAELGLTSAQFHNSNGLPSFDNSLMNGKRQNRMSANDMLRLVTHIMAVYPQITDITSQKDIYIESFDILVHNSNPLLYNLPGVTGLKTGTTARAGNCLVASRTVRCDDGDHTVVTVEFGAETAAERGQISEILMRYAENCLRGEDGYTAPAADEAALPDTAEEFVRAVVKTARAA